MESERKKETVQIGQFMINNQSGRIVWHSNTTISMQLQRIRYEMEIFQVIKTVLFSSWGELPWIIALNSSLNMDRFCLRQTAFSSINSRNLEHHPSCCFLFPCSVTSCESAKFLVAQFHLSVKRFGTYAVSTNTHISLLFLQIQPSMEILSTERCADSSI
jgi:hypothetical protein